MSGSHSHLKHLVSDYNHANFQLLLQKYAIFVKNISFLSHYQAGILVGRVINQVSKLMELKYFIYVIESIITQAESNAEQLCHNDHCYRGGLSSPHLLLIALCSTLFL